MEYINLKRGSVLSVVVTIFIMIALISASLIILLKNEIIYLNPQYISGTGTSDNVENNNTDEKIEKNILDKYEGIIKGSIFKQMLLDISTQNLTNIIVYISENAIEETNATKENASIIMMTNARITNSTEYTKIIDDNDYKIIIEKNNDKVVERIYVIKISNNI